MDYNSAPVTAQPRAGVAPAHLRSSGHCPPGLEYLAQIDQLVIKQQIELFEILTGCEMQNKYRIYNSMGQQIYYAHEDTNCCMRYWCGPARGFTINITDNNNQEVMRIVRPFKCCAGCCWCADVECCSFELQVEAPVGNVVGYARQLGSCWKPVLGIYDADHQQVAVVRGPCCVCNCICCGDVEFPVSTLAASRENEETFGMCAKQWSGTLLEIFTDADMFNVRFPVDLDVKTKATMLGAMFLIDFMFFEKGSNN